ncbi:hypothetical protein PENARI_c026G09283 [Penicillium arizonense]|uniref:LysM domain-containing protein n=1 Tax=Penicillium arizonense TaxID=1835702 RepID=A0A1F5L666_PENAI|nr:hypothetical protein PENARI_c026G09283 [Penicillium arizonense]OGE48705.1 hypothetical protein PENARI_c026G09283 [Penicillium arizonense]
MVAITIRNIACLLGVASLGASVAVDTTKVDVDAAAWKMTELCVDYYTVGFGDTCWDIISRNQNKFTMRQLLCWNTDINPWCSNLIPGRQVCVGVDRPGPVC